MCLYLQVILGGNNDIDVEVIGPNKDVIYIGVKKIRDNIMWTTQNEGEYQFCFSNEFSVLSHKVIYFDFEVGDNKPVKSLNDLPSEEMTQVCCFIIIINHWQELMLKFYSFWFFLLISIMNLWATDFYNLWNIIGVNDK